MSASPAPEATQEPLKWLGPHNCPSCKAEAHIADLKEQIAAHVCTDAACGELVPGWSGRMRRPRCWLWWGSRLKQKLSIAEHNLAHNRNHHCKPHYCSFGAYNCASWIPWREALERGLPW